MSRAGVFSSLEIAQEIYQGCSENWEYHLRVADVQAKMAIAEQLNTIVKLAQAGRFGK